MATADELILEAEFAFRNISPGSTTNRKYTARAKRYAMKVIRRFPTSAAADQARNILYQLGAPRPIRKAAKSPHASHTPTSPHSHTSRRQKTPVRPRKTVAPKSDSWQGLWRKIIEVSYLKKRVMAFAFLFAALIIVFVPFLWVFFIYYFVKPNELRNHAHKFVDAFV